MLCEPNGRKVRLVMRRTFDNIVFWGLVGMASVTNPLVAVFAVYHTIKENMNDD